MLSNTDAFSTEIDVGRFRQDADSPRYDFFGPFRKGVAVGLEPPSPLGFAFFPVPFLLDLPFRFGRVRHLIDYGQQLRIAIGNFEGGIAQVGRQTFFGTPEQEQVAIRFRVDRAAGRSGAQDPHYARQIVNRH